MTDEEIVREAFNELADLCYADESKNAHAALSRIIAEKECAGRERDEAKYLLECALGMRDHALGVARWRTRERDEAREEEHKWLEYARAITDDESLPETMARLRAEVERLKGERDKAEAWAARLRSWMSEGSYQTIESEQAWKARAQSAEASLAELGEKVSDLTDTALDQDNSNVHIAFWQEELRALRSLLPTSTDKGGEDEAK